MVMDTPGAGLNLVDQMNLPVYVHLNSSMSINPAKLFTVQNFWKYFVSGDGLFADTGIGGILTEFPGAKNSPEKDNKQDSSINTAQIFEPHDQDLNEKITDGINDEIPANSSASDENNTLREKVEPGNPTTDWGSGKSPVGLLMFNMGSVERESYAKAANLALEVFDRAYPDMQNSSKEGVFLLASCLQPHSRGHVKQTQELRRQPSIQPNYLSDHRDVQCMKDSFRLLERFVETPTMQRIGASVHYPQLLRCSETKSTPTHHHSPEDETAREISINNHGNGEDNERRLPENASPLTGLTDEEIECVIRTLAFTGYHPIGTLKMGPLDDKEAVVDLQLRVRGVEGVRVMDASVLPSHTTPAPAALVALYAARTAYLIKKTWSPIAKVRGVEPCYEAVCGEDLYYTSSSGTPLYSLPILVLPYLVRCVTRCP
ncbi:Glucose-methanol-choline oxidoreductase C-terminal [Trinorchestia longiramus]|nr:Glucose-methanol-choline oxidoreductase C-terminal [Trinorchestia longiramus]